MIRRLSLALGFVLAFVSLAAAAQFEKWNTGQVEAARAAGQPYVIHVTASWCGTCQAQEQVMNELSTDPAFAGVTVFMINFDDQKDLMAMYGATQRSTLIAFKGETETARIVADTSTDAIAALFKSAL